LSRRVARRQLVRDGWLYLALMVLPVLISGRFGQLQGGFAEHLALPLFIAGLCLLFLNLPRFTAYKHALIATEAAADSTTEPVAWATLRAVRLQALRIAALPVWVAAVGGPLGLEPVAQLLLTCGSLVLWLLYRVPRQLR
jgi:hypothetical protein